MSVEEILRDIRKSNVTSTIHETPYAAISPTRPELSQKGRAVLITGGGTGAGFAMARAFVRASASTVIIIGRRAGILEAAKGKLEEEAKTTATYSNIRIKACDVLNFQEVDKLWKELEDEVVGGVDVYVANAAKFTEPQPMFELGVEEVWSQVETNVKSPLYFAEKFWKQPGTGEKQKFILNISTGSIHAHANPAVAARPAYTLSKLSGTLLFQLLAQNYPHDKMQIVSFHPGLIYNDYWKSLGLAPELFDSDELAGAFAVFAASKEAAFLNGRFVWCSWDVEELATGALRKRIEEDFYFLRAGIVGLNAAMLS